MTATLALICALLAALIAPERALPSIGLSVVSRPPYRVDSAVPPLGRSEQGNPVPPPVTSRIAGIVPPAVSHGVASWFAAKGYQGAVPWWKAGQQPVWATASRFADGKTYSVTLLVTGFCQCLAGQPGERLIDLSPSAFRALGAPLSVGLIRVTMTVPVQGPRLPATDTLEGS